MDFIFPNEIITEGKIRVAVPRLSAFREKPSDYAPSKAPVFYNPKMELNRDIAILALQTHQKKLDRELYVSEPLTGCGLRGVRLAVEVEGIRKVLVNDISSEAEKMAHYNVELNKVKDLVEVSNEDANLFLCRHAAPRKRFDYVDIDPFGSPVSYIDSAVRSLRNGGLLALTATDMAPLCGVHPKACLRKYGGVPLRTEYCHEQAVRFVAGSLAMVAAKHEIGIDVLFSYSIDHYVRIYAIIAYGAKVADKSVQQMGFILHCFGCFHREIVIGITSHLKSVCPVCGLKLSVAGPMWLGRISDKNWCSMMEKQMTKREFAQHKKITKILSLVQKEAEASATYYAVDKICDKFNLRVPPQIKVLDSLKSLGFLAVLTHFNSRGFRTDAPVNTIREVITELATN